MTILHSQVGALRRKKRAEQHSSDDCRLEERRRTMNTISLERDVESQQQYNMEESKHELQSLSELSERSPTPVPCVHFINGNLSPSPSTNANASASANANANANANARAVLSAGNGRDFSSIVYWRNEIVPGKYRVCERTFFIVFSILAFVALVTFLVMVFNPLI